MRTSSKDLFVKILAAYMPIDPSAVERLDAANVPHREALYAAFDELGVKYTKQPLPSCLVRVQSYDESADLFTLAAVGFTDEDEVDFPEYSRSAPDFDDFIVPGIVLPALIGQPGEPHELLNKVFAVTLP